MIKPKVKNIVLSERDTRVVLDALDKPRMANKRMVKALESLPVVR